MIFFFPDSAVSTRLFFEGKESSGKQEVEKGKP